MRPSLIYSLDEMDRGTAGFADRLARGERLSLFSDVLRNPIWIETLAEALFRLAYSEYRGVLNIAGRQTMTREHFGRTMLAYWNISDDGLLDSATASDISASIPLDLRLDVTRAETLLDMTFPGVDHVLESFGHHGNDGLGSD